MPSPLLLNIADFTITLSGIKTDGIQPLANAYQPFIIEDTTTGESNRPVDVSLHAFYGELPEVNNSSTAILYETGRLWNLYSSDGERTFIFKTSPPEGKPWRMAQSNAGSSAWKIFINPSPGIRFDPLPHPLAFPLAELIMVDHLSRDHGVMLHACGVKDGQKGYIFSGRSGAGKSTMAGLWMGKGTVLNDDRTILRRINGAFFIYGTPWHGGFERVANTGARLEALYFIEHADRDWIQRIDPAQVCRRLLTNCWPPVWNRRAMDSTLSLFSTLANLIPGYSLGFRPESHILEEIRNAV